MSAFSKIQSIFAAVVKYGGEAIAAVAKVQTEVGASAGDPNVQNSKKALAVAYVLAAAHAGEDVPNTTVQAISAAVEMAVSIAKALGLFGKTASASGSVTVPSAAPPAS